MPRQTPHPQTIFHLIPNKRSRAGETLKHPDNEPFVSYCKTTGSDSENTYGLEIGYHVPARPRPQVIVEVGRDADLILPGSTISKIQFSFEVHPDSHHIIFHDRSRLLNTKIDPVGFRADGHFRQVVLQPGVKYTISAGGEKADHYIFYLVWPSDSKNIPKEIERGYQMAETRLQNPRWARTVEEGPTELPSWYNTRLHTPAIGAVQRVAEYERLGEGSYGKVHKAVDLDSGCLIAVKKIILPPDAGPIPSNQQNMLRREVKILSSISHKNIVEYLGSSGWDTETVCVYLSLKAGNITELLEKFRTKPSNEKILTRLLHEMLEALDYLAFRNWIHRDVKPDNILYTPLGNEDYLFQLADFGLANQQKLARTVCGSLLYMAPELFNPIPYQSSKMDVWSLFVVIGVVTRAGGLDDPRLADYSEILPCVQVAAATHRALSPMAQKDPVMRASAAQTLAKYFDGQGLSTPRGQIRPILEPPSILGQPPVSAPRRPDPKSNTPRPNAKKPAAHDLRRARYNPLLRNRKIAQRDSHLSGLSEIKWRGGLVLPPPTSNNKYRVTEFE